MVSRWPLARAPAQELRKPLGVTIVGGLIFSQLLTLYTTPVIYLGFASLARRFGKKTPAPELQHEVVGQA